MSSDLVKKTKIKIIKAKETMQALNYADEYKKFLFFTLNLSAEFNKDGELKKKGKFPDGWQNLTKSIFESNHNSIAIVTGVKSNITVIDYDDKDLFEKDKTLYPEILNYYVKNNKGYHCYFTYNEKIPSTRYKGVDDGGIDFQNNGKCVFAPPSTYQDEYKKTYKYELIAHNEIKAISEEYYKYLLDTYLNKREEPKKQPKEEEKKNVVPADGFGIINENIQKNQIAEINELADIINICYLDNFTSWTRIIWALRAISIENLNIALLISKKSKKFEEKEFFKVWNSYKTSKDNFSGGTFYHYCKISEFYKYSNIRSKYHDFNEIDSINDNEIAKTFVKMFGCDFVYFKSIYYYFNGIYWTQDLSGHFLKLKIANELSMFYLDEVKRRLIKINDLNDETAREIMKKKNEKLLKLVNDVQNTNKNINIQKMITNYIENNDIEWETNPHLFIFKNKIIDLTTCEFVEPCRDDYMCISTGYDYTEPSGESIDTLNLLLEQVFPVPDERKLYLIILSSGLCGKTLERFINANGNGGNGKGFLNELTQCVMGNYAYTCGNNVLLNPIKAGNNPEVANMNHKRVVFYREPDTSQNQKLNVATIKELTGGKDINARLNYSNNTTCNIKATHILECNDRPKLSGKIDGGVVRRFLDIPFRSTFTKNPEEYAGDHVFQGNDNVKTYAFQQEHKMALFKIILQHWKIYFEAKENLEAFIPESVKERTKIYLEASDEIKEWFDTEYEAGDKNDFVQISDIYENFTMSMLFTNLSKKEKRENSKKAFTERITSNINFKKSYKDRHRRIIEGKQFENRQVFLGFKPIKKIIIEPEDGGDECNF